MSEREAGEGGSAGGLPRLPPGRHGLDREFVTENQRSRLTAGIISVVAERGYRDATVSQICAAAGVSRRTFYSYFSSKEECYVHAFESIGDFIEEALREAGTPDLDWPGHVSARLAVLLQVFAANPDLVRFTAIAPLRAGESIAGRHRVALERVLASLKEGQPPDGKVRDPSATVEHAMAGGMMALIARAVEAGRGAELPDLLPDLVELFLTPYVGRERATEEALGKR